MKNAELGFLLLCCDLGQGEKPLTLSQLQQLRLRVRALPDCSRNSTAELTVQDIKQLGYSMEQAVRIAVLLDRKEALSQYLHSGSQRGIVPLCLNSPGFPARLRQHLPTDCPPVLFLSGNAALLNARGVALVGSRQLAQNGKAFARKVGELAAREKLLLISGHAQGADAIAEEACLQNGGSVLSFVADELFRHTPANAQRLYVSESGWHLPFSAARALGRNRLIHALGELALVAQSGYRTGGTWRGTAENLQRGFCPVYVHNDGSAGARGLLCLGAQPLELQALHSLRELFIPENSFL